MKPDYTPPKGSTAEKVIAHLTEHGGTLDTNQVAELFDVQRVSVSALLRPSLNTEPPLLAMVRGGGGRPSVYSLPEPAEERDPDAPLDILCYTDGDTVVRGMQVNEDDSVTFSRKQLEQLVRQVTQPHIGVVRDAVREQIAQHS